jgi:transposase
MVNSLSTEKKVMAISVLAEGSNIREVERALGVHRQSIRRWGGRVGEACTKTAFFTRRTTSSKLLMLVRLLIVGISAETLEGICNYSRRENGLE